MKQARWHKNYQRLMDKGHFCVAYELSKHQPEKPKKKGGESR